MPYIPGEKIRILMDKWNQNIDDLGMTDEEVFQYANELTMTLKDYEKYLRNQS